MNTFWSLFPDYYNCVFYAYFKDINLLNFCHKNYSSNPEILNVVLKFNSN